MSQQHLEQKIIDMMSGKATGPGPALFRGITCLLKPFYQLVVQWRNQSYDTKEYKSTAAHCPVISIGNITTGGVGKTPMVVRTARQIRQMGHQPAVILRGYKSTSSIGSEEAILLQDLIHCDDLELQHQVPVITNPDRLSAAKFIEKEHPEVDCILLDDGFQHRRIKRDLDVVLVDASNPFGFGHVLPRGLLREPLKNLKRADLVIITHAEAVSSRELEALEASITKYHRRPPIALTQHRWLQVLDQNNLQVVGEGFPVIAACGIGNPQAFFDQVKCNYKLLDAIALPDHYAYDATWLKSITQRMQDIGAEALIITEKDWVKIAPLLTEVSPVPNILRPQLGMHFLRGEAAFHEALSTALEHIA